jgi:hypothetical protein
MTAMARVAYVKMFVASGVIAALAGRSLVPLAEER